MTPSDRLALAACRAARPTAGPCPPEAICSDCRLLATAVAHELAAVLRDAYGYSVTADWIDANC